MFLNVDLGNLCNFSCAHCASRSGPHQKSSGLNEIDYMRITEFLNRNPISILSFVGGEPTLYIESINSVIDRVKDLEMTKIQIVTNGWFSHSTKQIEDLLKKVKKLDSLVASFDKHHKQTWDSIGDRVANLKSFCSDRIRFTVEVVIDSIADLITTANKINDPSVSINYQHIGSIGRAIDNNLSFEYPNFQTTALQQRCPQLGSISYHHGKGFSFCCSNLAYNGTSTQDSLFFDSADEMRVSEIYRLLSKKTFEEILKEKNDLVLKFLSADSNICNICEKVFSRNK